MRTYHLKEHLLELKQRILVVFVSFIIAVIMCYYFSNYIYNFLLKPLIDLSQTTNRKVIYTGLTEAFFTYLKLSVFSGFMIILPIITFEIYQFIKPGLYKTEKKLAVLMLTISPLLFWLGAGFVFYVVIPKAWHFFLSFENNNLSMPILLEARISEYLDLVIQLIIAFGVAFQLPIVLLILTMLGIIDANTLKKKRRLAIVINFIIAGILTPPDVLSQFALALPLLLLYEISIVLCKFIQNRNLNA